jgi:peptidoglycan-N-acetylglucosamine deacetylase
VTSARPPRVIWHGPRDGRSVALTFDDGPHPDVTPKLLEVLAAHGAVATFFLVGQRAARWPEIAGMIAQAGHRVGSHGYDHRRVWWGSTEHRLEELDRTEEILGAAMAGRKLFRPPYGMLGISWYRALWRRGYQCAMWNAVGRDWLTRESGPVFARLLKRAVPGRAVLLHECNATTDEGYLHTVDAVDRYLQHAEGRGWRCVGLGPGVTG